MSASNALRTTRTACNVVISKSFFFCKNVGLYSPSCIRRRFAVIFYAFKDLSSLLPLLKHLGDFSPMASRVYTVNRTNKAVSGL